VTVDLRIVAPTSVYSLKTERSFKYNEGVRFAPLPAIMAAKRKPLEVKELSALVADTALTTRYFKFEPPAQRGGGIKVKDVKELVEKLASEAKVIV
jgi:electron transfer flavoprotein beta subunit